MPIQGLTTQVSEQAYLVMPRLGMIRKGSAQTEKPGGKKVWGRNLDYFRFVPTKGVAGVEEAFVDAYGPQPKILERVFFHSDDPDVVFSAWNSGFNSAGQITRRCDGQEQHLWLDDKGSYKTDRIPCEKKGGSCDCKARGNLAIVLEPLLDRGFSGYVELVTSGIHDIKQISAVLSSVMQARGQLRHTPFVLTRIDERVGYSEGGKRKTGTQSNIKLCLDPAIARAMLQAAGGEAASAAVPDEQMITMDQRKELWQKAQICGWSRADFVAFCTGQGYSGTDKIPVANYSNLLAMILPLEELTEDCEEIDAPDLSDLGEMAATGPSEPVLAGW